MNQHARPDTAPIPFIDVAAQRRRLGRKVDDAITRVLDHCQFIMGPEVRALEADLPALATGIPVVTTTRAGGAEAITPWSGAVVAPDDPRALAASLEWIRGVEPARLAAAARAAAEPFTWERQVADFEQIYRRLPSRRGGLS